MDADHALAALALGEVDIALEAVDVELREPHAGVVFEPGDGPAFTAFEFGEDLVDGVPS